MSAKRHHAPMYARTMGQYGRHTTLASPGQRFYGARGSLSGRRILIKPSSGHKRAALTATLTYLYCNQGRYYALLDVLPVETVVGPADWELLKEAA